LEYYTATNLARFEKPKDPAFCTHCFNPEIQSGLLS